MEITDGRSSWCAPLGAQGKSGWLRFQDGRPSISLAVWMILFV